MVIKKDVSCLQAFCAGRFSVDGKENLPCLVYVDFRGQLWLYYNVGLPFLRGVDFITALKDDTEVQKYFKDNKIDTREVSPNTIQCILYITILLETSNISKIEHQNNLIRRQISYTLNKKGQKFRIRFVHGDFISIA